VNGLKLQKVYLKVSGVTHSHSVTKTKQTKFCYIILTNFITTYE